MVRLYYLAVFYGVFMMEIDDFGWAFKIGCFVLGSNNLYEYVI